MITIFQQRRKCILASFHDFSMNDLQGTATPLSNYKGKLLLVVNTASRCGFTPQLDGLQALHVEFKERGFSVLGFPSNDFLGQEPLEGVGIEEFCRLRYGVDFPLFEKIHVRGRGKNPLYEHLTSDGPEETQGPVRWNFTKFLVDREGRIVARFAPNVEPNAIREAITSNL
jgi:glutathione peroxidase